MNTNTNTKNNDKEFLVREIRSKYTEKEYSSIDELKRLDRAVKRPAEIFAYSFGILSSLVMGFGMSLVMTDIGKTLGFYNCNQFGVVVGIVGLFLVSANYPMYKKMISSRRKKYSERILALSEKILEKE